MKSGRVRKKVLIGLSGGVDSSLAAYLLKQGGWEVIGVYIKIFPDWLERYYRKQTSFCPWAKDQAYARQTAAQLKIPFYIFDFSHDYDNQVLADFLRQYRQGRTPNPDARCNKYIKFGRLIELADKIGADYVATGHYVKKTGVGLFRSQDKRKDQSYFLWMLNRRQLARSLFPLGDLTKSRVRSRARRIGLVTADRPDSQGICFLGQIKVADFLRLRIKPKRGEIITSQGEKIGFHAGAQFYTLGQRLRQADISSLGTSFQGKNMPAWYVVKKDLARNRLIVGQSDDQALFSSSLSAIQVNWLNGQFPPPPPQADNFSLECQIRHGQNPQKCRFKLLDKNKIKVEFQIPQRAITAGQSIVIYQGDRLLGGGVIAGNRL